MRKNVTSLRDLKEVVEGGGIARLPKTLLVDLASINKADFTILLAIARTKSSGIEASRTISSSNGASQELEDFISNLRSKIHNGNYNEVHDLALASPMGSDPEVRLELARSLVFSGQYRKCIEVLSLLDYNDLNLVSQGTAHQLHGHALFELGRINDAIFCLSRALNIAQKVNNDVGSLTASLFLMKCHAYIGDGYASKLYADNAFGIITYVNSFRWLLGYYRSLSHSALFMNDPKAHKYAAVGIALSQSINDSIHYLRGIVEYILIARKLGLTSFHESEFLTELESHQGNKDVAFLHWADALVGSEESTQSALPFSLKIMTEPSEKNSVDPAFRIETEIKQNRWLYDIERNLLVDFVEAKCLKVKSTSPMSKLIILLSLHKEPVSQELVFEKIWGLKWHPGRHQNILNVTVSRLNKLTPSFKISKSDDGLYLSNMGLLI